MSQHIISHHWQNATALPNKSLSLSIFLSFSLSLDHVLLSVYSCLFQKVLFSLFPSFFFFLKPYIPLIDNYIYKPEGQLWVTANCRQGGKESWDYFELEKLCGKLEFCQWDLRLVFGNKKILVINHTRILVLNKFFDIDFKILCHPICNWL